MKKILSVMTIAYLLQGCSVEFLEAAARGMSVANECGFGSNTGCAAAQRELSDYQSKRQEIEEASKYQREQQNSDLYYNMYESNDSTFGAAKPTQVESENSQMNTPPINIEENSGKTSTSKECSDSWANFGATFEELQACSPFKSFLGE